MTRYAIDAPVALALARDGLAAPADDQLVGPSVLRSDALALLFGAYRAGEVDARAARATLDGLAAQRIRLLGDRVSRAEAWRIADRLGWDAIGPAEYLAVARLQADVLVSDDPVLARAAEGLVPVVGARELTRRAVRREAGE